MPESNKQLPQAAIIAIFSKLMRQESVQEKLSVLEEMSAQDATVVNDVDFKQATDAFYQQLKTELLNTFKKFPALKNSNSTILGESFISAFPKIIPFCNSFLELFDDLLLQGAAEKRKNNIPECALLEENLIFGANTALKSYNDVSRASIPIKGKEGLQPGFFKRCNDKYPVRLAIYTVAFSLRQRLAVGKRVAQERLVYDNKGCIVGTFSFEIPGFIPLNDKNIGIITTEELINSNVAPLLVTKWLHKDDDVHPKNFSLQGCIDGDMSKFNITYFFKGERFIHGLLAPRPIEATRLKPEHLKNFPRDIGPRSHWVTKPPSTYAQDKVYPCMQAFIDLSESKKFQNQTNFSLLTELLAFQSSVYHKQLYCYLGTIPYAFDEIDEKIQQELLQRFGRKTFFNADGSEKTFAEHIEAFDEREYCEEMYPICTKNKDFLSYLFSTKNLLEKQIDYFRTLKHDFPEFDFNVEKLERHFLKILHDSLHNHVSDLFRSLYQNIMQAAQESNIHNTANDDLIFARKASFFSKSTPESLHSTPESIDDSLPISYVRLNHFYKTIRNKAYAFFSISHNKAQDYQVFFLRFMTEISLFNISDLKRELPTSFALMDKWLNSTVELCQVITLSDIFLKGNIQSTSRIKAKKEQPNKETPSPIQAIQTASQNLKTNTIDKTSMLKKTLIAWLNSQTYERIKEIIQDKAIPLYTPSYLDFRFLTRKRVPEIDKAIDDEDLRYETEKKDNASISRLLTTIFQNGGWEQDSFNTTLIRLFVESLFSETKDLFNDDENKEDNYHPNERINPFNVVELKGILRWSNEQLAINSTQLYELIKKEELNWSEALKDLETMNSEIKKTNSYAYTPLVS